ncbi:MAG: FecR domain-containing protein [Alphaproteobacteria bacterium]|nr:FecR domain-containing protein [Alphaproteobacteria bacterium]
MKHLLTTAFLALMLTGIPLAQAETTPVIGTFVAIEGAAAVNDRVAKIDDAVHLNDKISTGPYARAVILFSDDTELTLSENTSMTVDRYVFDPANPQDNAASYNVLTGAFLYVSGLIAKDKPKNINLKTAYGSIGIRGTAVWGGETTEGYGILVTDGAVTVANKGRSVALSAGEGTTFKNRASRPARAKRWAQDRINRAVKTITLQRPEAARERIKHAKARRKALRDKRQEHRNLRKHMEKPHRRAPMQRHQR